MENSNNNENNDAQKTEFKRFATKRVIVGVLVTVVFLWVMGTVLGFFGEPSGEKMAGKHEILETKKASTDKIEKKVDHVQHKQEAVKADEAVHLPQKDKADEAVHLPKKDVDRAVRHTPEPSHTEEAQKTARHDPTPLDEHVVERQAPPSHQPAEATAVKPKPKGVAFVEATIKPLRHELNERWWGWRPNDILDFTDNVNNYQLGVLEVTRRTTVILAERISRTGTTAAFDNNIENAMNWFMIKSDGYWFPSPESKYKAGLKELETYKEKLERGEANFYTRTDNLIPLLMAYEDLLGSCEENLVKEEETGGEHISFFRADDYFFYAQGVASAMGTILEAIMEDFLITLESRRGIEVLHHAIESCHHAAGIHPLMITNSSLSGVLANHRANLAAPMSHARFYIGVLIKTLST